MDINGKEIKLDDVIDAIAEAIKQKEYKEVYTYDECISFYKTCESAHPLVSGFVLSVKKNYEPKNDNDKLIIIQGMIDSQKKPVKDNNGESLSKIEHAGTIDKELLTWLDGKETKIMLMKK
ncbi:MAG: hypothetical protein J5590_05230 [Clostridia bacterium]|nr:hypothetical protein [Clostridia bacterium]